MASCPPVESNRTNRRSRTPVAPDINTRTMTSRDGHFRHLLLRLPDRAPGQRPPDAGDSPEDPALSGSAVWSAHAIHKQPTATPAP